MMVRVLTALLSPKIKLLTYKEFEACNRPIDGYSPSPGGLLEVGRAQYLDPLWLRQQFKDNHLVKIFFEGLPYLPGVAGFRKEPIYTVIFMHRSEEEIKASVERSDAYLKELEKQAAEPRIEVDRFGGFDMYKEYNAQDINHVLSICDARKDIEVIEVQFENFVKDTKKELLKITEQLPLLITKESFDRALAQVNPEFHRIKCG
jgi:hypothetical protein